MAEKSMTLVIPEWKRAYMYEVWALSQNDHEVHRQCDVHLRTVSKYRLSEDWEGRLAREIEERIAVEPDKKLEVARARAIRELRIVRGKALEAIMKLTFTKASDAWKAYREALDQEMQLRGHQSKTEISLIMIAAARYQERAKQEQDPKDITDQVEVH